MEQIRSKHGMLSQRWAEWFQSHANVDPTLECLLDNVFSNVLISNHSFNTFLKYIFLSPIYIGKYIFHILKWKLKYSTIHTKLRFTDTLSTMYGQNKVQLTKATWTHHYIDTFQLFLEGSLRARLKKCVFVCRYILKVVVYSTGVLRYDTFAIASLCKNKLMKLTEKGATWTVMKIHTCQILNDSSLKKSTAIWRHSHVPLKRASAIADRHQTFSTFRGVPQRYIHRIF